MPSSGPIEGVETAAGVTVVNVDDAVASLSSALVAVAFSVYVVLYASGVSGVQTTASSWSGLSATAPGTDVPASSTTLTSPSSPSFTAISRGVTGETSALPSARASDTSAGAAASAADPDPDPLRSSPLQPARNTRAPAAMIAAVRRTWSDSLSYGSLTRRCAPTCTGTQCPRRGNFRSESSITPAARTRAIRRWYRSPSLLSTQGDTRH